MSEVKKTPLLVENEVTVALTARIREIEAVNEELRHSQNELLERQRKLRDSEEKFSRSFQLTPLSMTISTEPEGKYLDVNQAFLTLVGYSREEVIGHDALELGLWVDLALRARIREELAAKGGVRYVPMQLRVKSGEIRTALYSAERILLGNVPHVIAQVVDLTDRRREEEEERDRLESQLAYVQKMETVGRLAGGVAHDFNNLLTAIVGSVRFALLDMKRDDPLYEALSEVLRACDSAATLTRQLLSFSRRKTIEPKRVHLNDLLLAMQRMLNHAMGEDVELVTVFESGLGVVKVDPSQVEQVVVNLALNARDAMPDGGKLTIETHNVVLDETYCARHVEVAPGEYVMLAVSDTGCGMSAEVQTHLFEPFFTTKERDKGTGLGLATVYGAVKQNHGSVEVNSESGRGTTFKIYFPKA